MNAEQVYTLLETCHEGALATLNEKNPFVSLTGFLYGRNHEDFPHGIFYFFLSDLARHARYIKKNSRVSLLIASDNLSLPVHERERATVTGEMTRLGDDKMTEGLKQSYLKIFPRAEIFFKLADFHFYRLEPEEIYWVGGFGKVLTLK